MCIENKNPMQSNNSNIKGQLVMIWNVISKWNYDIGLEEDFYLTNASCILKSNKA